MTILLHFSFSSCWLNSKSLFYLHWRLPSSLDPFYSISTFCCSCFPLPHSLWISLSTSTSASNSDSCYGWSKHFLNPESTSNKAIICQSMNSLPNVSSLHSGFPFSSRLPDTHCPWWVFYSINIIMHYLSEYKYIDWFIDCIDGLSIEWTFFRFPLHPASERVISHSESLHSRRSSRRYSLFIFIYSIIDWLTESLEFLTGWQTHNEVF